MTQPPVSGTTHTLPFDSLSPRDFERLSLWLVEREGYERAEHLGAAGSEQGRDLLSWREGEQWAFQCKRVRSFGPADALREVDKVATLPKEELPVGLVFIVTCDVSALARKRARDRCAEVGLQCHFWMGTEFDQKVKRHPEIVREFFQVDLLQAPPQDLFTVPFIRNPDFVGRQDDLERLHQALNDKTPVGIRPAGLTGMGGIGKTQLAVEYAYRYQDSYPGGILWINAAEHLTVGFAELGRRLRPATTDRSQEEQIRAAASYLQRHSDALLVFDNLADPAALNRPVVGGVIPAALACRVLFTTRRRDLGRFTPVEVTVLPEDAALQLLLRHPSRQAALDPDHPEHGQARTICRLLGRLPLALEVAGAFLGEWPDLPLVDFRARLRQEGVLATLDEEADELSPASLPLIHNAAVAATLQTQWDALADKDACLLLRVAGQLPEAAQIPVARLGLLSGVPDDGRPGHPPRLARALKHLERASLVEELQETQIRLHPLVREFAARQTPEGETLEFRGWCAANLAAAYDQFALLQDHCARRGIDVLQGDLLTALALLPSRLQDSIEDTRARLQGVLRLLQREAHNLRGWVMEQRPVFFAQQTHCRANALNLARLATGAAAYLTKCAMSYVDQRWRASSESLALERTLTGHEASVLAVAVTPDGRRAVSASDDWTVRVWDLDRACAEGTGQELAALRGHEASVLAVAVTPDGRRAVSASDDWTVRVWDLDRACAEGTGQELAALRGHEAWVRAVAVTPDGRRAVSASDDRTVRVWDLDSGQEQATVALDGALWSVSVAPDGITIVTGDGAGNVYCLRYVEPPAPGSGR